MRESKEAANKKLQKFTTDCPKCGNCQFFKSKKSIEKGYMGNEYIKEHTLRCGIGDFKVSRSNHCQRHEYAKETIVEHQMPSNDTNGVGTTN